MNTRQHYRAILKLINPNMKVLNIHVTNVNIRQYDRTSLRPTNNLNMRVQYILVTNVNIRQYNRNSSIHTNNLNMKVFNIHVTNVNSRQQHIDFLRLTNNLNMKVLNIPVPNVNIRLIKTFPHSLHISKSRLCYESKCLIKGHLLATN